jgi:hypothetical protein
MYWQPNEEEDDDETIGAHSYGGRDGFIVLIDCRKSMFDPAEKFKKCLSVAEAFIKNRIVTSEKDLVRLEKIRQRILCKLSHFCRLA